MPDSLLRSPAVTMAAGAALILAVLALALVSGHFDLTAVIGLAARTLHVLAAMVWVGLIVFVNVIQLAVLSEAAEADRAAVLRTIVPRTAATFKLAANLTLVTGIVLLFWLGYLTQAPPQRALWMWLGTAGGIAMLGIVHARISPALRVLLDPALSDPAAKAGARATIRSSARLNLLLSGPVTFAMIAAAHAG